MGGRGGGGGREVVGGEHITATNLNKVTIHSRERAETGKRKTETDCNHCDVNTEAIM